MAIEILPFAPAYQDAVLGLVEGILCDEYGVLKGLQGEQDLVDIAATYAPPDSLFLVVLISGELVATGAVLHLTDSDCELRRLYVRADHRREGLASSIVSKLLDSIRGRGYKRLLLELRPEMHETVQGYGRYGFASVTQDLPRPGEFLAISF